MPTDAQNIATARAALCGGSTGYPKTVLDTLAAACDDMRAMCTKHGLTIPTSPSSGVSGPYYTVTKPSDDVAQQTATRWPRSGANHNARELALYAEKLAQYLLDNVPTGGTTEPPDPGTDGVTAAAALGWGTPDWADEFDYTGAPDTAKWDNAPTGGMPGHAGNGRRIGYCTTVGGGMMTLHGYPGGDTGWCRQKLPTRYGRWEIRLRSRNLASSGNPYHVLALIWPTSERWPEDGEYDWVEYMNPDSAKLSAFLHYPHNPGAVQQEYAETPAQMGEWQNIAFEWTATGLVGYLNGQQWFRYAGGATSTRRNIQDMPEGYLTFQLDNFYGTGMREAVMDVAWVRFWAP